MTGRGPWFLETNDTCSQVRFELAFKACNPSLKVIAPWRMPEFIQKFQYVCLANRPSAFRTILTVDQGTQRPFEVRCRAQHSRLLDP